jgi:amino acid adenylation domain-containing protein
MTEREAIEGSIGDRFRDQLRRAPDRLAVRARSGALSYAELNAAANQVANALLDRCGEGAEPVALLLDQDIASFAAILGVLKAGKFYVPLDLASPPARASLMLQDAGARLIVTDEQWLPRARELAPGEILVVNVDPRVSRFSAEDPSLVVPPDALCCLFYTSGSTGHPKGVPQTHRNLLWDMRRQVNDLRVTPSDRFGLFFSPGFSASVSPIFGALLTGAAVLPFPIHAEGLGRLAEWLNREGITICDMGVTMFRGFAATLAGQERFPAVRMLCLSGDRVTRQDVALYRRCFSPDCLLQNAYGATETRTVCQYFLDHTTPIDDNLVPVGYPVEGKEVLLLNEAGVPIGGDQIGAIAVRSAYLSPGYWRRPELTRAAFLPDPKGGPERIYQTGDVGRWRSDGCLVHLGRKDAQVKIRGYRVEVADVESALLDLDGIRTAVVMAQKDRTGDRRLVAYVVPENGRQLAPDGLRRALAEKLPPYLIPSLFVTLPTLPLTPTGKIDRRALPSPTSARPELSVPYVAPRGPIEEMLAAIWAEVLDLEQVGIHDRFLDLGGHSLQATQIIARVHRAVGVLLPLEAVFAEPTVAGMAAVVARHKVASLGEMEIDRLLVEVEALPPEIVHRLLAEPNGPIP